MLHFKKGITVPSTYGTSGTGIANTDLAIYVTARQSTGTEIAWAIACQAGLYKPIFNSNIFLQPNFFSS